MAIKFPLPAPLNRVPGAVDHFFRPDKPGPYFAETDTYGYLDIQLNHIRGMRRIYGGYRGEIAIVILQALTCVVPLCIALSAILTGTYWLIALHIPVLLISLGFFRGAVRHLRTQRARKVEIDEREQAILEAIDAGGKVTMHLLAASGTSALTYSLAPSSTARPTDAARVAAREKDLELLTRPRLLELAKHDNLVGRHRMTKEELIAHLALSDVPTYFIEEIDVVLQHP